MLETINNETFYSPEELAKKFKLSLSSVYKLVRSGEIPSIRLGKIYRIPGSDLEKYLHKKRAQSGIRIQIPKVADAFVDFLQKWKWKKRIKEIYLYGSYARGDFNEDSDVDLCIIVDQLDRGMRQEISHATEKAMEQVDYQELLSVHEESLESWERMKKADYPLVQNILREGIALWKNH
ncbi:MAG: helix-turn-helix domain-containing protein [Deltaproteobacteria bacterium]|nr:helix-turn-helix domain-containing protein [Deltaproteobacteria bacterium]